MVGDILQYDSIDKLMERVEARNHPNGLIGYIEAQYHGGVHLNDVNEFLLYDKTRFHINLSEDLRRRAIAHRIIDTGFGEDE